MTRVVDLTTLLNLERVSATAGKRCGRSPGISSTGGRGSQGSDGVEVAWVTFSQDDGRRPITASIGDGDRLTSLNRARCGSESQISLGGRMSSEGREAEDDRLEQLHFESMWKL